MLLVKIQNLVNISYATHPRSPHRFGFFALIAHRKLRLRSDVSRAKQQALKVTKNENAFSRCLNFRIDQNFLEIIAGCQVAYYCLYTEDVVCFRVLSYYSFTL